ncbi:ATP-binding protein [Methanobrevibacter sp.]
MVYKPDKLLWEHIKTHYSKEIDELNNCNHQHRINVDYTLLNNEFINETGKGFFEFPNYRKFIDNVEKQINTGKEEKQWLYLKIVDVPPNILLDDLDSSFSGDIISAKAMIKNITETKPTLKTAVYTCRGCNRLIKVNINDNIIVEPSLCPECGGKSFTLNQELSEFRNYRYVKLEELLEYRTGGNSREFKAYMTDYLASPHHNLKAGDVVDIVGDFTIRKTDKSNKKNDFEFLIDLHNINPVNNVFEDYRITEEDKKEIIALSQQPNIYNRLVKTLAPEIVGYHEVKEGLLLQLFEGYRPADDVFKHNYMDRWTSHILLIGDPGIGKSQLITALKMRVPKIIDINGADTTKAGLTTSAVKDELTGSWTLEAGALILADTGVLCIDEFDKLNASTQKSLNQAMEQLTVSSTKAGLVQTMSARTSIVACANPKYSRFNPYKPIKEQINIPESTLSRFDLVFALNDRIEREHDTELATSLLNKDDLVEDVDIIDTELFKKYITYAKLEVFPRLNDEAKNRLINFYVDTRQSALKNDSAKPITARDLKALERLTIMRAKTELRNVATVTDAENSIRIYCKALETIGLSPETKGELENVLSDAEAQVVNDAEQMITAKMQQYDISNVNELLLSDIRHEIKLLCHSLNLDNGEELINIALGNVRSKK